MPISPEAKAVTLHPRNVELLRGNVTAAYLMQFFIDRSAQHPTGKEPFAFTPVHLSIDEIREHTGLGWDRIRTATNLLIDRGFLEKSGNIAMSAKSQTRYLPILNKLSK